MCGVCVSVFCHCYQHPPASSTFRPLKDHPGSMDTHGAQPQSYLLYNNIQISGSQHTTVATSKPSNLKPNFFGHTEPLLWSFLHFSCCDYKSNQSSTLNADQEQALLSRVAMLKFMTTNIPTTALRFPSNFVQFCSVNWSFAQDINFLCISMYFNREVYVPI